MRENAIVATLNGLNHLDIEAAIAAHKAWARRFEEAILGIDADKLEGLYVADDTKCVLGCWLHQEGKAAYSTLQLYYNIVDTHRQFHRQAQFIVNLLQMGNVDDAEIAMKTNFTLTAKELVDLLEELKLRMQ